MNLDEFFFDPKASINEVRKRLPHWSQDDKMHFISFHLIDSMPKVKLDQLHIEKQVWINAHPQPWSGEDKRYYIQRFQNYADRFLDAGYGKCILRIPGVTQIVDSAIMYFEGEKYRVQAFVIMPNHLHILLHLFEGQMVMDIYKSWKKFMTTQINRLLNTPGEKIWPIEPWDRVIRNEAHYIATLEYIHKNYRQGGVLIRDFTNR